MTTERSKMAQRQDSLTDQMTDVVKLAIDNGCYDAADWIKKVFAKNCVPRAEYEAVKSYSNGLNDELTAMAKDYDSLKAVAEKLERALRHDHLDEQNEYNEGEDDNSCKICDLLAAYETYRRSVEDRGEEKK